MTWSSTAVDVSNYERYFAGYVNSIRDRLTIDLQEAGLDVMESRSAFLSESPTGSSFPSTSPVPSLSPSTTQLSSFAPTLSPSEDYNSMAPSKERTLLPTITQLPSFAPTPTP